MVSVSYRQYPRASTGMLLMISMLGIALINLWFLNGADLREPLEEASAKLRSTLILSEKAVAAYQLAAQSKYQKSLLTAQDETREVRAIQSGVTVLSTTSTTLKASSNVESRPPASDHLHRNNDDLRCGSNFGGKPCDPRSSFPCCSQGGWCAETWGGCGGSANFRCGSTPLHCQCSSCIDYREVQAEELQCVRGEVEGTLVDSRGQRYKKFNSTEVSAANALWCYSSTCDRDHRWFKLEAALHHCTNLNDRCDGVQCTSHPEGERCFVEEGRKASPRTEGTSKGSNQFYLKCPPLTAKDQLLRTIAPARYDYLPSNDSCTNVKLEQVFNPRLTMLPFKEQGRDPDCHFIDTTYYDNFFETAYRLCDGVTSKLFCTIGNNPLHPVAADNANLCWGEHLHLNPKLAQKAHRLKHREWMSGSQEAYFNYKPGLLSGQCDRWEESLDIDHLFTGNFIRDLMESATWKKLLPEPVRVLDGPTVLTWRESNGKREDQNLWHSYMHYLNVYQALTVFGIEPGPEVRVIFLDNNIQVWHSELMNSIAGEVLTLGELPQEEILLRGPVVIAPSMHNTPFQATHYEVAISKSSVSQPHRRSVPASQCGQRGALWSGSCCRMHPPNEGPCRVGVYDTHALWTA